MLYSINLMPERDTLDGHHLVRLTELWIDACRSRLDPYTVAGYQDKVRYFVTWWTDVGPWHQHQIDKDLFVSFAKWLTTTVTEQGKPLSYNTRNDVLRRLRQCLKWGRDEGFTGQRDFSIWVPHADGAAPLRSVVPVDALRRLMTAAGRSSAPIRDAAILALLIQTGVRRAECASIQIESITMAADLSGTLRVFGKRTKRNKTGERIVAFDGVCGRYLDAWLIATNRHVGPLLVAADGVALTAQGVAKAVKRVIRASGLQESVQGCHDLRRAFVTHWRKFHRGAGYDHLLRMQVGHASDAISDLYDLADMDDLQMAIRGPLTG